MDLERRVSRLEDKTTKIENDMATCFRGVMTAVADLGNNLGRDRDEGGDASRRKVGAHARTPPGSLHRGDDGMTSPRPSCTG